MINNDNSVYFIYFDLSKSFDNVSRKKLIANPYQLGKKGSLLALMHSYLSDRHMRVKVGSSVTVQV